LISLLFFLLIFVVGNSRIFCICNYWWNLVLIIIFFDTYVYFLCFDVTVFQFSDFFLWNINFPLLSRWVIINFP
jgi:hypothetical protein